MTETCIGADILGLEDFSQIWMGTVTFIFDLKKFLHGYNPICIKFLIGAYKPKCCTIRTNTIQFSAAFPLEVLLTQFGCICLVHGRPSGYAELNSYEKWNFEEGMVSCRKWSLPVFWQLRSVRGVFDRTHNGTYGNEQQYPRWSQPTLPGKGPSKTIFYGSSVSYNVH